MNINVLMRIFIFLIIHKIVNEHLPNDHIEHTSSGACAFKEELKLLAAREKVVEEEEEEEGEVGL